MAETAASRKEGRPGLSTRGAQLPTTQKLPICPLPCPRLPHGQESVEPEILAAVLCIGFDPAVGSRLLRQVQGLVGGAGLVVDGAKCARLLSRRARGGELAAKPGEQPHISCSHPWIAANSHCILSDHPSPTVGEICPHLTFETMAT